MFIWCVYVLDIWDWLVSLSSIYLYLNNIYIHIYIHIYINVFAFMCMGVYYVWDWWVVVTASALQDHPVEFDPAVFHSLLTRTALLLEPLLAGSLDPAASQKTVRSRLLPRIRPRYHMTCGCVVQACRAHVRVSISALDPVLHDK